MNRYFSVLAIVWRDVLIQRSWRKFRGDAYKKNLKRQTPTSEKNEINKYLKTQRL